MFRLLRPVLNLLPKTVVSSPIVNRSYSSWISSAPLLNCVRTQRLLQPVIVIYNHNAGLIFGSLIKRYYFVIQKDVQLRTIGLKVKGHLKKRCEHCYYVKRRGRLYIECKEKPRHKQMQMLSKEKLFAED